VHNVLGAVQTTACRIIWIQWNVRESCRKFEISVLKVDI